MPNLKKLNREPNFYGDAPISLAEQDVQEIR